MRKIRAYFSTTLKAAFAYRIRSFIWFLIDVYPTLIFILFFSAIFSERQTIGNYSLNSILIYYLTTVSLNILIISHPEWEIAENINQGFLSIFLLRPMSFFKFYVANELAYKTIRLGYLAPSLLILTVFFDIQKFIHINLQEVIIFLTMATLAFLIYLFIKILIGFAAFWFTEITWLLGFWESVSLLFSGLTIPIDLMPPFFQKIAAILPAKYSIYLPAQIILGRASLKEQFLGLSIQIAWLIFLIIFTKKIWRKGIKIYSAYGG